MPSICGCEVRNCAGTKEVFSSNEDARRAYSLLCDYEAFLSHLVQTGKMKVVDFSPQPWPVTEGAANG